MEEKGVSEEAGQCHFCAAGINLDSPLVGHPRVTQRHTKRHSEGRTQRHNQGSSHKVISCPSLTRTSASSPCFGVSACIWHTYHIIASFTSFAFITFEECAKGRRNGDIVGIAGFKAGMRYQPMSLIRQCMCLILSLSQLPLTPSWES